MKTLKLRFRDRCMQGNWFHLTTVDGTTNRLGWHTHDYDEVFWVVEGACRHDIGEESAVLVPGDVVFVRSSDRHRIGRAGKKDYAFTNLALAPSVTADLRDRFPEETARLFPPGRSSPGYRLGTGDYAALELETRRLARGPHTRFALEHFLLALWIRVLPQDPVDEDGLSGDWREWPEWLAQALVRLDEPLVFRRGVPGLVAVSGRSAGHLSRACRHHLRATPSQLVNRARLRHAAYQLRTSNRLVTDIAAECGFPDPGRFYRLFKTRYLTTPKAYREPKTKPCPPKAEPS